MAMCKVLVAIVYLIGIMNPTELALVRAIAASPDSVMKELNSPTTGLNPVWLTTPAISRLLVAASEMSMMDKPISWLVLVNAVPMSQEEREAIKAEWVAGKAEPIDWRPIVSEVKTEIVKRDADKSINAYQDNVRRAPARVREHLATLGSEISIIANDGEGYNPNPSEHLNDLGMSITAKWGDWILDAMFSENGDPAKGGRPSYGLVVSSMPSGHGKSTMAITMAAHALAYDPDSYVVIMSNELPRVVYSGGLLRALRHIYANRETDEAIKQMLSERCRVYAPAIDEHGKSVGKSINTFDKMRQILFWHRPSFAVIDSVIGLRPPEWAVNNRYNDTKVAEIMSDSILQTCTEFGVLLYAPGNMSKKLQDDVKMSPDRVTGVMLYGSQTFENSSDYSLLGWRDRTQAGIQHIKRCKNRHGTSFGEVWDMVYDVEGGYYRSPRAIPVT